MPSFDSFDDAQAAAGPDDMVCGALLKSGEPAYFLMPRGTDQELVRDAAFQLRHGRPMNTYERWLLSQVEARHEAIEAEAVEQPA